MTGFGRIFAHLLGFILFLCILFLFQLRPEILRITVEGVLLVPGHLVCSLSLSLQTLLEPMSTPLTVHQNDPEPDDLFHR